VFEIVDGAGVESAMIGHDQLPADQLTRLHELETWLWETRAIYGRTD
jgi:hypothetical protein